MKHLVMLCAVAIAASAQMFEVASIKPNHAGPGSSGIRVTAGRVAMENVSLKKVTLWAYGIPDDREYALVGPDWLTSELFDIQASFPAEAQPQQVRLMTQSLLADRFKLALHPETRQLPFYALTVAKTGPKIRRVEDGQTRTSGRPGRFQATKISMHKFADLISNFMKLQVVDETGVEGVFDFTLEWSPDEMNPGSESAGASLFTALQEQLGLKLEGRKGPVDVLVVDHMEKAPTKID
jgi:uncharacterized protein (TIGR03435 family)